MTSLKFDLDKKRFCSVTSWRFRPEAEVDMFESTARKQPSHIGMIGSARRQKCSDCCISDPMLEQMQFAYLGSTDQIRKVFMGFQ